MSTIYDFSATTIDGTERALADYRGKTLLIVNTASKCGFTPQYAGLEGLYRKYKDNGLMVLGFPCNQFGRQEPGDESEIKNFCSVNFDVSFPLFAKVDVNGENSHPLYRYLKHARKGVLGNRRIIWNFTKFLVAADGRVIKRYPPNVKPERIESDLLRLWQQQAAA